MPKLPASGSPKQRQPLEGEHIPAPLAPMPKRLRLNTARDIRRELARLYSLSMNGSVTGEQARTGGFLLRCMLESLRLDELESRILALENQPPEAEQP